jgi:hypothetical protein
LAGERIRDRGNSPSPSPSPLNGEGFVQNYAKDYKIRKCYNVRQENKMTIQIKKTYQGLNPGMLCDEVKALLQKQGIIVIETESQTYGLPSGDTQSRTTLALKTPAEQEKNQKECGSVHILGSPQGETKMLLDIDETLFPQEKLSAFQGDLDFILGSYEIKW